MLKIEDLHVEVDGKLILKGINLEVEAGQVHAIMGPNGSGKSTLAYVLAGRDGYEVTKGRVLYKGQDLLDMAPELRAAEGLFLGFQYPVAIPGVSNIYFLKAAVNAIRKHRGEDPLDAIDFMKLSKEKAALVQLSDELTKRSVGTNPESPTALNIRVKAASSDVTVLNVEATLEVEVIAGSGMTRQIKVTNKSPGSIPRAFNGAASLAVIEIFSDREILSYLAGR